MSKNRKTDKAISILLSLLLAFGVFSVVPFATGSQAAVTGLTPLPTTTGATLTDGNRYVVSSNTDIGAVANTNGLIVADNATVLIYIPSGVTLNVSGGAGSANTGGKAGIYLPGSSTLIVAGGGTAYINACDKVAKVVKDMEGDEKTGGMIVLKALESPLYRIAENAGLDGSVIVNKVKEAKKGTGFNAMTEEYVDMVQAGIIDPAKVTKSALQNAVSVASTLLTTEAAVADIPAPEPPMPQQPMGMM